MDYRRNLSKSVCEGLLGNKYHKAVPSIRETWVHKYPAGSITIEYHRTEVVTFLANGGIILNSGGWLTTTTKARINAALHNTGWRVWQDGGVWYVGSVPKNAKYIFTDGMEVSGE